MKWTSPGILAFAYYKGYISQDYFYAYCKLFTVFGSLLFATYLARGIGRHSNTDYNLFINEYTKLYNNSELKSERREFLYKYDFQMKDWAPDYVAPKKHPQFKGEDIPKAASLIESVKLFLLGKASYVCINTFGLRMMYPGVILQHLIKPALIEGRAKIMEIKRASTDGNASFYEVGIFIGCIDKGFSTIGWNYPGFGESVGLPFPDQVTSSIDAIMQYAFSLGFKAEDIILYSWSIGGFPTAWAANYYPDVKGIILDACFDNIVHLAKQHLPEFASDVVEFAIKTDLNLNILDLMKKYSGPVRVIRRTKDEIVSTIPKIPSANRGNDLLIGILKHRYPYLLTDNAISAIRLWLGAKSEAERYRIYNDHVSQHKTMIEPFIKSYIEENSFSYPMDFGKETNKDLLVALSLYLASKYLDNFESTHCQQLPLEFIQQPWHELNLLLNSSDHRSLIN